LWVLVVGLKAKGSQKCLTLLFSCHSPPIHDFDVFKESKEENFFESQGSIDALCSHLLQLKPVKGLREEQIQDEFFKLLQVYKEYSTQDPMQPRRVMQTVTLQ
jgi:hypothetical protein